MSTSSAPLHLRSSLAVPSIPSHAARRHAVAAAVLLSVCGSPAMSQDRPLDEPAAQPAGAAAPSTPSALPPVTVLGARGSDLPLSNVPGSITRVSGEEVARQQATAQRIEDILSRTIPGFNPTNGGVRQIRGRTAQVFINGVPSNEQMRASAGSDINLLSPDQIDAIEVGRGANSAYGFGSPGGIIALSTPRAQSATLTRKTRIGTSFNTRKPGGSFQSSVYQSASQIVGDFDYHVGLSYRKDGLSRDPDGNPALDFNSPAVLSMGKETLYDLDTSLGQRIGDTGRLRLTATAGRMEVDERWDSDETGTYRQSHSNLVRQPEGDRNRRKQHTVNLSYDDTDVAGSRLKLEAVSSRVTASQYTVNGAVTRVDEQNNRYTGLRSSLTTPLGAWQPGATVTYGVDHMRNRYFRPLVNADTGEVIRYYSPDVTLTSWAPYLQGQVPVGDWRFNAGVRHERYSGQVETAVGTGGIEGGDIRSFALSLFNAGVVYTLAPGRAVYGSFSQGAEVSQLGRAATTAGVADRVDPQPAKSDQYELGYRQHGDDVDLTAAAFYSTSDLMSSLDCSDPLEPCKPLREPRKFWGLEGTAEWRIDTRWTVGGTVGWMNGERILASGETRRVGSNEVPPVLVGAFAEWVPADGTRYRVNVDYRGSRDPFGDSTDYPEGRVDSLVLAHASAEFSVGAGQLQVGVRNLFNRTHYAVAAESFHLDSHWIPEQGRRLSVSYAVPW